MKRCIQPLPYVCCLVVAFLSSRCASPLDLGFGHPGESLGKTPRGRQGHSHAKSGRRKSSAGSPVWHLNNVAARGRVQECVAMFEDMCQQPDADLFKLHNLVLKSYACIGDPEGAGTWFNSRMLPDGAKPNVVTYGTILHACSNARDMKLAQQWFDKMCKAGIEPNIQIYNNMIRTCGRLGKPLEAEGWLKRLQVQGLQPDSLMMGTVIDAWARQGDSSKALEWLNKLPSMSLQPTVISSTAVMSAAARSRDWQLAVTTMEKTMLAGLEPDCRMYSTVIAACAKSDQAEKAEQGLKDLLEAPVDPSVVAFMPLIQMYSRESQELRRILSLMKRMMSNQMVIWLRL